MSQETPASTPSLLRVGPLPVVRRRLQVRRVTDLTPNVRRITFGGDDLAGFDSPGADDHIRIFFDAPAGEETQSREYTPRAYRQSVQELDIDFVLHGSGLASSWAAQAKAGDEVTIGGPRGSLLVSGFTCFLLVGDEAALPALARRLEELPAGAQVTAIIEVQDARGELPLSTQADLNLRWVHREQLQPGTGTLLRDAVREFVLPSKVPPENIFVWVGCERAAMRDIKADLLARGLNEKHLKATAYWTREDESV